MEGDTGILSVHPKDFRPHYEPSKRRLTWPNGAVATLYNATEPDQLRGPQHDAAWMDELAKWKYARETYDQVQFGLRLGIRPRQVITTTPRNIPLLKEILAEDTTRVTRGNTSENMQNLAPAFLKKVVGKYVGTRLGRQELNAEILEDITGGLWDRDNIDKNREVAAPTLRRVVVAIDPSGTKGAPASDHEEKANDVGIIVAAEGVDKNYYILDDLTCDVSPAKWGQIACDAFKNYGADRIIAETNFGGAMVEAVIRAHNPNIPFKAVTASRGKVARAEPVAALYEQNRVKHVGSLAMLEDQMMLMGLDGFKGDGSPDRVDALVWALTELAFGGGGYTIDDLRKAVQE